MIPPARGGAVAKQPKPTTIRQPRRPDRAFASGRAQAAAALVVGLLVAVLGGKHVIHISTITVSIASAAAAVIVLNAARAMFLLPAEDEAVHQPDPAQLTGSITSAVRSSYAISSNWLTLWSRPNFRYYLHLDAVASLIAYSFRFGSSLQRISRDEADVKKFYDEGEELMTGVVAREGPVHKHRLRVLIYPQWVYNEHRGEIEQLIRSHSAARISCIPLVADRLYDALTGDERTELLAFSHQLGQTILDKTPPRARLLRWYGRARLSLGWLLPRSWTVVFPDFLLVDSDLTTDTSSVWWYPSSGNVKKARRNTRDNKESQVFAQAVAAFDIICRHSGEDTIWDNYAPEILGGVAIGASTKWLDSEAFFDREHYELWRTWIGDHWRGDDYARTLKHWMDAERDILKTFVDDIIHERAPQTDGQVKALRLLDVGCGTGDDIVATLKDHEGLHATGVDIVESNISRATALVRREHMGDRVALIVGDAATLIDLGDEEVDMAICMTNTLGNLTPEKQDGFLRRLHDVLRPTGRALISVYAPSSVEARKHSYKEIDLHVHERGDCLLATEGLRSQHFDSASLRSLIERSGLAVCDDIKDVGTIGLAAIVRPASGATYSS
jgi:ubiquinone/menaquinone biosynthesis C-methylase UbiE